MSDPILTIRDLKIQFQTADLPLKAVDGLSIELERGQTIGIVGESGSGKSVTALSVMGLIPHPPGQITGGEIWFRESAEVQPVNLLSLSREQLRQYRGGKISMIFQEPMTSLNPVYSCGYQIVEAIQQHCPDLPLVEARRQAINLMQEVKLLPDDRELLGQCLAEWQQLHPNETLPNRLLVQQINLQKQAMFDRYPHQLSGGQIQRVMIAMAICCNPSLLIADEPTTALDVTVQARTLDLLRELRDRRGMSILFITHDLGIMAEIADRVAVMYRGRLVECGSVLQIFSDPQHPYTKGLLACRPQLDRRMQLLPTVADFMEVTLDPDGEPLIQEKPLSVEQAIRLKAQIGSDESDRRCQDLMQQPPLLAVENLQVGFPVRGMFGGRQRYAMAVNGVSFQVFPGETLGLVGESGCGKSTLARTLLRLIKPISGQIHFDGKDVTRLNPRQLQALRRDIQIIFQDPFSSLDPRIAIGEAVMEPLKIHGSSVKDGRTGRERRQRMSYLLDRVGIDPGCSGRFPHEFSGGQRQRICIARALALNPKFIICDESVSALDVSVQAQVLNLLKELQREFNLTYIFISHDLSVVKFMSDRIMVMNAGKIAEIGMAEQIYRAPQQAYTRQLIAAVPTGNLEAIRQRQLQRGAVS
ncbi:MAG: ABC transporter ATP-binding protein [Pegethrix bostrychoides GSE-TBD4-15B]|uniref:ABC transporter ATP-binding protein n=1 Tax=Pegethrix bostrychoides GSE-TBD4-15B TaxID=2839662 RepID=A0A951U8M6_9CYAN|nr:ABC transporter ATP-binding protein [Pegethrix bostrychoides GSE-TBD4-15B]